MTFAKRVAALIIGLVVAVPGTANASFSPEGARAAAMVACSGALDIGLTTKSGSSIKGEGSYTYCYPTYIEIHVWIEKYLGLGIWPDVTSEVVRRSTGIQPVSYNCTNTGTQTYRTVVDLWGVGGDGRTDTIFQTKYSNEIRVTC